MRYNRTAMWYNINMNKRVGKQKAKETLPHLLDLVKKGLGPIEIIDKKRDETIAYLGSPDDFKKNRKKKSYFGILKGKLEIAPDFDEPDWELIKLIEKSK